MRQSRLRKWDRFSTGFTGGILLPLFLFLAIYLLRYNRVPLIQFVLNLSEMKILIKMLSLCGFADLLLFFYFYRMRMDRAARGVIAATFTYGFLVLISRFL
jgi:hypothetical protein